MNREPDITKVVSPIPQKRHTDAALPSDLPQALPDRAVELFRRGYNCAQSIYGAFSEKTGIPFDLAVRIAEGLGGGLCRMRQTCGAVSGAMMILSTVYSTSDGSIEHRRTVYERGQKVAAEFTAQFGTLKCAELLQSVPLPPAGPTPTPRTAEFYASRPCVRILYEMAKIVEKALEEQA